jgi:hypothetical protein
MKGRWLSPESAAEYLDVRVDALPRLFRSGRVPAPDYRLGPRSPRYDREALDKAMGAGVVLIPLIEPWRDTLKRRRRERLERRSLSDPTRDLSS